MGLNKNESKGYVLFLAPALFLFTLLFAYPVATTFKYAFTNWDGYSSKWKFVGMDNFLHIFSDTTFFTSFKNTLLLMVVFTVFQNIFALAIAVALNSKARLNSILRAVYFLPVMLSPFVMTYIWKFMFSPLNGPINIILNKLFGFPQDFIWLMNGSTALWCVGVVQLWLSVGFAMAIYLAGLQSIPSELLEAGNIDGVSSFQSFIYITFPLLSPAFKVNLLLNLVGGLKTFDVVYGLTQGGPGHSSEVIMTVMVKNIKLLDAGYGSAIGIVLFIMITALSVFQLNVFHKREVEM